MDVVINQLNPCKGLISTVSGFRGGGVIHNALTLELELIFLGKNENYHHS